MNIRTEIIKKALVIAGSSLSSSVSGSKYSKAEMLAEEFADSSIEEVLLSASWDFAINHIREVAGDLEQFTEITGVTDCLKVDMINPSNLEWYTENGRIYFKGNRLDNIFYHSGNVLQRLLEGDRTLQIPSSFKFLVALSLASQISFALYSDSIFTEGLRRQYLLKLEEVRNLYSLDCNIVNSGRI